MNYFLRVAIGLDQSVQSMFRMGTLGITISSRIGTGVAHGHKWALIAYWLLDHTLGKNHCREAIRNDRLRAHAVLKELSDPAVVAYLKRKA